MGSTSTKRKSSSLSKKGAKNTSEVKKQKRDYSRSRKNKSKKLARRKDSTSFTDDESNRLSSSSSSEDSYRRKRSRSRMRKDGKRRQKRARRSPSSSGTSLDSPRVRRRKVSKRKTEVVTKKKTNKKFRRDVSTSSTSKSSCSCSLCWGGTSSSADSKYYKPRGRSERKERVTKDRRNEKSENKTSRPRSRSSSSRSRCSKSNGCNSEDKSICENNAMRLRSVITVVKEPEQDNVCELDKDRDNEQFIYDHDDYPSCRSNDSNEWGSKRELDDHSFVPSEKWKVDNVKDDEAFVSNDITSTIQVHEDDFKDRYDGCSPRWNGAEASNQLIQNEGEVSAETVSPKAGDLESILRQRALENLLKFRGRRIQKNANKVDKSNDDAKPTSIFKTDSVQNMPHKEDGAKVISATQEIVQVGMATVLSVSSSHLQNDEHNKAREYSGTKSGDAELARNKNHMEGAAGIGRPTQIKPTSAQDARTMDNKSNDSVTAKQNVVSKPSPLDSAVDLKEKVNESAGEAASKITPGSSTLRQEPLHTYSTVKQILMSSTLPKAKSLTDKSNLNKSAAETLLSLPKAKSLVDKSNINKNASETGEQLAPQIGNNNNGRESNIADDSTAPHSSTLEPVVGESSSKDIPGEMKDGSQYEQKTMSVMRGGEMVQVSYKVYIPTKTPALARRKLKR